MLSTIFGIILIFVPFLLVFSFPDRRRGLFYIFSFILILHSLIAFFSQLFNFFTYSNLITIYSLIDLSIIGIFIYRFEKFKPNFKFKINFLVVIGFLIIFANLYSVHFSYSGDAIVFNNNQKKVSQAVYKYPYFSDEWIAISWINYTIENNELPIKNPLIDKIDSYFPNIFIGFFSFISEIFLVLNINPLTTYVIVSLAFNLIICLLFFSLLRVYHVNSFISLVATMVIPYITNGSNLPGFWYFIPFNLGLITILLSFIFLELKEFKMATLIGTLSLFFYPPFLVFIIPTFIIFFLSNYKLKQVFSRKNIILVTSLPILLVLFIVYSQPDNARTLWQILFNSAWRLNLDGGIPTFYPWLIIPIFILPLVFFGFIKLIKEKKYYILGTIIIALFLWLFYMNSQYYIFIDYARVVIFSSLLLLLLLFGLGLEYLLKKFIKEDYFFNNNKIIIPLKITIIFCFFILSNFYTTNNKWQELKLKVHQIDDFYLLPSPPANFYLHDDDLRLFSSITKIRFLAPPWKSLVIGVATNNYPLHSKASIITNNFLDYDIFLNSSCEDKNKIAKKYKLVYIYSNNFFCDNFIEVDKSVEGLYLYKFSNLNNYE